MKELLIEEKAKRYDDLLVKLQKAKVDNNVCDERYCCVIDNIVPELAESEDERIRKTLIAVVNLYYGEGEDEEKTACLYWLEKQKKEEPSIADIVDEHFWEMLGNEKQGEQNLVKIPKFKSGDTIEFNGLGHNRYTIKEVCGTSQYINSNGGRMDMSYTDANFKLVEQKPAEWSEEDEKILSDIIKDLVHPWNEYIPDRIEDKIKWLKNRLKSLKDRAQPQTKQEWSEEDERMMDIILNDINYAQKNYSVSKLTPYDKKIDWLKSLRPQNRWKPSDEHIEALEHFVRSIGESGYASPYDNNTKLLYSLLEQLKKLKG